MLAEVNTRGTLVDQCADEPDSDLERGKGRRVPGGAWGGRFGVAWAVFYLSRATLAQQMVTGGQALPICCVSPRPPGLNPVGPPADDQKSQSPKILGKIDPRRRRQEKASTKPLEVSTLAICHLSPIEPFINIAPASLSLLTTAVYVHRPVCPRPFVHLLDSRPVTPMPTT